MDFTTKNEWSTLSPEQKKRQLYERQVAMLDGLLQRRAISQADYDKSVKALTEKMGYETL